MVSFREAWSVVKVLRKPILAVLIPVLLAPLPAIIDRQEAKCGYVVLWMALYWMFEPIPLAATALIPVVFFPLFGILTTSEACAPYMKDTIMMYIGGLTLAAAVEHCNLHKRIALKVLLTIGTGARWLMLGFMMTTMFLSMWISNTATTAMMVPIVDAVLNELEKEEQSQIFVNPPAIHCNALQTSFEGIHTYSVPVSPSTPLELWKLESNKFQYTVNAVNAKENDHRYDYKKLRNALLLSIAYSASCGGTGTVIGSGPNLVLKGLMEETYPDSTELTFATWCMYNSPGMLICVVICWIGLQIFFLPCCGQDDKKTQQAARNAILKSYQELGNISFHEIAVLLLFIALVVLWFLRDPQFITGWASFFPYGKIIRDATPAIGICLLLFVIPAKPSLTKPSPPLLDWKTAQRKISWGVLLLLGSGFAVSEAAKKSQLSVWLGVQLSGLNFLSADTIVIILVFMTSIVTEVISNMSVATIMLPVISQMAQAIEVHPLFLMLPVTIGCSFAMMLPVGNPSNAIVFDSSSMSTLDMAKPGFILKILCCLVELLMIQTLGAFMFNLRTFPQWASNNYTSQLSIDSSSPMFLLDFNDTNILATTV